MEMYLIIILVVLIALGLWIVKIYNGLVKLKVRINEAWSDIDVQLKRRYDLIPNLINTVKGYATHERELFENVTKARSNAMNAQNPEEKAGAENMLSGALKSLFAVSENYPQLKANENFLELQRELSDTENKIQASRRFYNGNVRDLNTKIQIFPDSIVAGMLKIGKREFFEIEDKKEKETPKVEF
ncbi:MAG: LemA family protein [Patescibacteria group bacterium]|nr:LemA family protein [Patescibacteria group bacterium]